VISSKEHDLRRHGQRPDDRDALLLTARKLVGIMPHPVGEAEALEELGDRRGQVLLRFPEHPAGREHDVLRRRHVGKEVEGLKDDADAGADRLWIAAGFGYVLPVEVDRAVVDGLQQVHAAQERRLARPRRADQADHLPLAHAQVHAPADRVVAEAFPDVLQLQLRAHRWRRRCLCIR
jgi:hypothetical protein